MSMNAQKVMQQDEQYVMHTYKRGPLVLESGKGMVATDADGAEYLDFTSGIFSRRYTRCLCNPDRYKPGPDSLPDTRLQ